MSSLGVESCWQVFYYTIALTGTISKTRRTALSHSFHLMERVLRLDCVNDKTKWKNLDIQTRLKTVKEMLNNIVGNNTGDLSDVWIMRDTRRAPGGVKVTFIDTETKFMAEKKLAAFRADKQKAKNSPYVFTTSRMAPVEFSDDRKAMESLARDRIAVDWSKLVDEYVKNGGNPDAWVTDPDAVKRCLRLRVKWKLRPALSVWTEVQDPLHRYVWKPFNSDVSFFRGYVLEDDVPCPDTKECLITNPKWKVPREVQPHMDLRKKSRPARRVDKDHPNAEHTHIQEETQGGGLAEQGSQPPDQDLDILSQPPLQPRTPAASTPPPSAQQQPQEPGVPSGAAQPPPNPGPHDSGDPADQSVKQRNKPPKNDSRFLRSKGGGKTGPGTK